MKKYTRPVAVVYAASRMTLEGWKLRVFFCVTFLVFLSLYIMLPVWTIPGNDLYFQLSLFSNAELALLLVLTFFTALLITMQIHLFSQIGKRALSDGGTGVFSAIGATLVGTAGCVGCSLGIAFGFLGMGAVLFFIEYQTYITIGAILLFAMALLLIARRIEGHCRSCKIR